VVITGSKQGITNPPGTSSARVLTACVRVQVLNVREAEFWEWDKRVYSRLWRRCRLQKFRAGSCTRTQAVKTLAEALAHQLLSTSVSVHLLVPGWTRQGR
jgi:hypothetical protein